jgi:hypothetical protein
MMHCLLLTACTLCSIAGYFLLVAFFSALCSVADRSGQRHAEAIHGKVLTACSVFAAVGPVGHSISNVIDELLTKVEYPTAFPRTFGCFQRPLDVI